MAQPLVLTDLANGVLSLTLNRPEVKNAMSLALLDELVTALDKAEADTSVRIIVIRGSDGNFSAGADIKDMAAARNAADPAKAIYKLSCGFGAIILLLVISKISEPRVIEQTIRQKLPEGFQRSEFLLTHGMIDAVVDRLQRTARS